MTRRRGAPAEHSSFTRWQHYDDARRPNTVPTPENQPQSCPKVGNLA